MSNMEKHLFNLKFAAKELQRNSKKCDKEEKAEKAKVKKAIQKGNMEVARIHAENAIRQKNQSINFLRMSARVDAVAARVQTAVTTNKVTKSMAGVVKSMDATLKSMNLEKISALMDKFEHQFETLDVQTAQMEDTMSSTTTLTTPENEVENLMRQMADEAGLDLNMELPQGQTGTVSSTVASTEQETDEEVKCLTCDGSSSQSLACQAIITVPMKGRLNRPSAATNFRCCLQSACQPPLGSYPKLRTA